jgi:hypothetical protein
MPTSQARRTSSRAVTWLHDECSEVWLCVSTIMIDSAPAEALQVYTRPVVPGFGGFACIVRRATGMRGTNLEDGRVWPVLGGGGMDAMDLVDAVGGAGTATLLTR